MSKHREAHPLRALLAIALVGATTALAPSGAASAVPLPDDPICTDSAHTPANHRPNALSADGSTLVHWSEEVDSQMLRLDVTTGVTTAMPRGVILDLSNDGRYALYAAEPPAPAPAGPIQLWRFDADTDAVELVTPSILGGPANGDSWRAGVLFFRTKLQAMLSDDGSAVVFESDATDLVAGMTESGYHQIFVRNLDSDTTTLVTRNAEGDQGDHRSILLDASGPGFEHVLMNSRASNLGGDDDGCLLDLYLGSAPTGAPVKASRANAIAALGDEGLTWQLTDAGTLRWYTDDGVFDEASDTTYDIGFSTASGLEITTSGVRLAADGQSAAFRAEFTEAAGLPRTSGVFVQHLPTGAMTAIDFDPPASFGAPAGFLALEAGNELYVAEHPDLGTATTPALLTPTLESKAGRYGEPCSCTVNKIAESGVVISMTGTNPNMLTTWTGAFYDTDGYVRDRRLVFADVLITHPFETEIRWLADDGLSTGFRNGRFEPAWSLSRQAMAVFLYRYAGSPSGDDPTCAVPPAVDVSTSNPFCGEIAWLLDQGIASNTGPFRPVDPVSRQATAAFLWRMVGEPAGPFPDSGFTDVPADHPFATAIAWMTSVGITNGYADGGFHPTSPVSRQATAAFLSRYDALP